MLIGELARRAGVTPRAIRLYEAQGLVRARRSRGGYREFDETEVRVLVFIRMSRALGLPLAQLADWVPAYRAGRLGYRALIDGLQQRLADIDRELARLQDLRQRTAEHIDWARTRQAEARRTGPRRAR